MSSHHYNIHGNVIRSDNKQPVANVRVEIWQIDLDIKNPLAKKDIINKIHFIVSAYTDDDGKFEMSFYVYDDIYTLLNRVPDFFFKVYQQVDQHDNLILNEEHNPWMDVQDGDHDVTLTVDADLLIPIQTEVVIHETQIETVSKDAQAFIITGKVMNGYNEGIPGKTVIAYDVDLKGAKIYKTAKTIAQLTKNGGFQELGKKATSDAAGNYSVSFTIDQYKNAERHLADVVVYAVQVQPDGTNIIGRSKMSSDVDYKNNQVILDVFLTSSTERGASEYAKLIAILKPFAEESGVQLFELVDSDEQIGFLASEIQQDKSNTSITVQAAKLNADSKLSSELFYGIGRQRIELDWNKLLLKHQDDLINAIKQSISSNYISNQDDKTIQEFVNAVFDKAFEFTSTSDENKDLFKTLGFTIKDASLQKAFLQSYARYKIQPQDFWDDLSKKEGFTPKILQSLQLTNQLNNLTNQNTALIEKLQVGRNIATLSDLLELKPKEWQGLVNNIKIPGNIPGITSDEKKANYIKSMQSMLNATYPTKKIAVMLKNNELQFDKKDIQDKVQKFLESTSDFNISSSRIVNFIPIIKKIADNQFDDVLNHLQLTQRIYQVSPTPEAMSTLIKKGYNSAYHIASVSQNTFLKMEAKDLGGTEMAYSAYNRAKFQVAQAQHIIGTVRDTQSNVGLDKIITPVQRDAISKYINELNATQANWSTLFGSPKDCECTDCSSVFSPASYLVDIMQFLDNCFFLDNKKKKSVLSILLKRRPDIGNLLLTCENTNTEIPYIDLVNEIMEYYVVFYDANLVGLPAPTIPPNPNLTHDTGKATAAELKAEPQYILIDAYKALYKKVYPFNLPYHQPLDVIRTYLNFLKTSRAELMEVFNSNIIFDNNPPIRTVTLIPPAAIDAEWIQLSLNEYEILTNKNFVGKDINLNVESYYGNPIPHYTSNGISVTDLLQRTGLQYVELLDILKTKFINPGQYALVVYESLVTQITKKLFTTNAKNIYDVIDQITVNDLKIDNIIVQRRLRPLIEDIGLPFENTFTWLKENFLLIKKLVTLQSSSDCNIDQTFLHSIQWLYTASDNKDGFKITGEDANISDPFLSKLHRFIRLWRKTGWKIHELDAIINALAETDITQIFIHKLSIVKRINSILNLPLVQLAALWGNIDTYGENSLYAQLFLKNTGNVSGSSPNIFQPSILNEILGSGITEKLEDHLPEIFAALSISADDYSAIVTTANLADNPVIRVENLSVLYRYKLLADNLGISIPDLCVLSGIFNSPFQAITQSLNGGKTGIKRSTIITDSDNLTLKIFVKTGSPQIQISATPSHIIRINFNVGDIIIIEGVEYYIKSKPSQVQGGLGSDTISFELDRNYNGTSIQLSPDKMQFYEPSTLEFIQKVQQLQQAGFSVEVLNYILTGRAKDADNIALPHSQILQALPGLRNLLLKIDSDNPASDADIMTVELLTKKLMLLYPKDITDQFLSMLQSVVPPVPSIKVPDQSYAIPNALSAKYNYKIAFAHLDNKAFQNNETVTDTNGSSAKIIAQSDSTLVLKDVQLVNPNNLLTGTITGQTSNATATITGIFLQVTGFMMDEEHGNFKNDNNATADFKTAIEYLYQQSVNLLHQQFSTTAPQAICDAASQPNEIFQIPQSLSPKYEYSLNNEQQQYYFKCNGIMTDGEKNIFSNADVRLQPAANFIYNYPIDFIKNNFSGFYSSNDDVAIKTLLNISDQPSSALADKMKIFYQRLLPFIISQLKQKQIVTAVSSLISLDPKITSDIIATGTPELIDSTSAIGLSGLYKDDQNNEASENNFFIDFTWGTALPQTHPALISSNFSVNWKGWLCPPVDATYLFTLKLEDAHDEVKLFIDGIETNFPLALTGGKLYMIEVAYKHAGGSAGIHLYWQSATMPQTIVSSRFLFPADSAASFNDKVLLYHRASQFITGFSLSEAEVGYIMSHTSDFSNLDFLSITLEQWFRINDYAILRKTIPANLLMLIFQRAYKEGAAFPSTDFISLITNAVKPNWNKDYLSYLIKYYQYQSTDFKNEIALLRIKKALDLSIKTKMPISDAGLPAWNVIEKDPASADDFDRLHDIAEQLKNAVKAKYKDNWLGIATQLNNKIRENQKQALISYLLTLKLFSPDGIGNVTDADGLFEYLLIDVQMTSAVMTSRIIQATLAVQLFVNRVSLKLESEVPIDAIDYNEWEWMKNYSLYAGLKQIPVYTENFLHSSLRDDKSQFFKEFESELKKSDITDENVETAFRNYLVKLNEVSNMEVCGFYEDTDTQTIYVFARTIGGKVTNYYFRIRDKFLHWQPWEQIQLDIKGVDTKDNKDVDLKGGSNGVHLIPVVWNKRLFLFWPEFTQKSIARKSGSSSYSDMSNTSPDANAPQQYWQINLAWSEYLNNKWTSKKLSKDSISPLYFDDAEEDIINLLLVDPSHFFWQTWANKKDNILTIYCYVKSSLLYLYLLKEKVEVGHFSFIDSSQDVKAYYQSDAPKTIAKLQIALKSFDFNVPGVDAIFGFDDADVSFYIRYWTESDNSYGTISNFEQSSYHGLLELGKNYSLSNAILGLPTKEKYDSFNIGCTLKVTGQSYQGESAIWFKNLGENTNVIRFKDSSGNLITPTITLHSVIELQGNEIQDNGSAIIAISELQEIYSWAGGYTYLDSDYTFKPFYQSLAKSGLLDSWIDYKVFLHQGNFKTICSNPNNISTDYTKPTFFLNSLRNSFIYTDIDRQKNYFATPVRLKMPPDITRTPYFGNLSFEDSKNAKSERSNNSSFFNKKNSESILSSSGFKSAPAIIDIKNSTGLIKKSYDSNMHNYSVTSASFAGGNIGTKIDTSSIPNGLAFYTFFHPFTSYFITRLNIGGVAALMAADTCESINDPNYPDISPYRTWPNIDTGPKVNANDKGSNFSNYQPKSEYIQQYFASDPSTNYPSDPYNNYYLECVDFSEYGTYSSYNWELFFHAPLLIATMLSNNGKYNEAIKWLRYILDLSSTEKPIDDEHQNSPYWQVLPFKRQLKDDIINDIENLKGYDADPAASNNPVENRQIDAWRSDPLNPFKIARSRPIAFMKNVLMTHVEICIAAGDVLFQTYTRENIMEAIQWYVMAHHALGPSPQFIPAKGKLQPKSYNDLNKLELNDFGDVAVQMENIFPNSGAVMQTGSFTPHVLGDTNPLYFCVPPNNKLLQYWQTISDRLFKIRHGLNIQGISVPLPLYEPPIDPELLLQAKAQGIDISNILADLEAPASLYRFTYTLQKAKEFCNEVISLGNSILSINEKHDAEALARCRQTQEIVMLNFVTDVKARAVLEAQANIDNLKASRDAAIKKLRHYSVELLGNAELVINDPKELPDKIDENTSLDQFNTSIQEITSQIDVSLVSADENGVKIIPREKQEMDSLQTAYTWQQRSSALEAAAGLLYLTPEFTVATEPFGVGVTIKSGGPAFGAWTSSAAKVLRMIADYYTSEAGQSSRIAGFVRREQDWVFQANLAAKEITQIDKQITAAQIRLQMAQHELNNHNTAIQNAQDIETFYETKFTNQELYEWMLERIQDVHKQGYQLAYDMARKAEKAYRFELGIQESNFIQYGYYNDSYSGITAGEQLQLALKQLESAYLENNVREFELTKHISIVQLNPAALIQLRETGTCQIDLPEELFDMDYPGHYFRRIKSVSVSIPCVAGPYTTINSTLRLQKNNIRINTQTTDPKFIENNIPFTAIATSSAQNDSGMFELNFRDERYLPFEGAGAISSWQLELNGKYLDNDSGNLIDLSQFNYDTISDVIIHLKYTSREDAGEFRQNAIKRLNTYMSDGPFMRLFRVRHEFPNEWNTFLNAAKNDAIEQVLSMDIANRFPYIPSGKKISINIVQVIADSKADSISNFNVISPSNITAPIEMSQDGTFGFLLSGKTQEYKSKQDIGVWKLKPANSKIKPADINDLLIIFYYEISNKAAI